MGPFVWATSTVPFTMQSALFLAVAFAMILTMTKTLYTVLALCFYLPLVDIQMMERNFLRRSPYMFEII